MLIHPYQTLVREIGTSTIPGFATASVQILKSSTAEYSTTGLSLVETICDSLSSLVPLYSGTLRPFSTQTQNAVRPLLAPTSSDEFVVPEALQEAARRLVIVQHYVAAKSGGTDEWNKHINDLVDEIHLTADQVLRAVNEPEGRSRTELDVNSEPCGGAPKSQYPFWVGIEAGSQRVIGLIHYLSGCLSYSTKGAVTIPLGKISDVISRFCLVARQTPKSQTWEQALQTKADIGKEEKEELWGALPNIHIAVLQLVRTGFQRLGEDTTPLALELLDHIVRVFSSGISLPTVRSAAYGTLEAILRAAGPTLSKPYVDALGTVIGACCRDLQEDSGHLVPSAKATGTADTKKNGTAANADLFLKKPDASLETPGSKLDQAHREAASSLLAILLSDLPQQHLKPSLRGLLDQTAILTRNRDAMVASVLNPFTDTRGRRYASILPHLTQLYPQDQALEILRTNIRSDVAAAAGEDVASVQNLEEETEDVDMGEAVEEEDGAEAEVVKLGDSSAPQPPKPELPARINPFESARATESTTKNGFGDIQRRAQSPPKRKHEDAEDTSSTPAKRQERVIVSEPAKPSLHGDTAKNPPLDDDDDDSDEDLPVLEGALSEFEDDDEDE